MALNRWLNLKKTGFNQFVIAKSGGAVVFLCQRIRVCPFIYPSCAFLGRHSLSDAPLAQRGTFMNTENNSVENAFVTSEPETMT